MGYDEATVTSVAFVFGFKNLVKSMNEVTNPKLKTKYVQSIFRQYQ